MKLKLFKPLLFFALISSIAFSATDSTIFTITVTNNDVDWCNLQYPASDTISLGENLTVYARVFEDGITDTTGEGDHINAWIGYSSTDSDPAGGGWTWISATYNTDNGNNDEYQIDLGNEISSDGTYYYASRFSLDSTNYKYGGYSGSGGGFYDGSTNINGILLVTTNHAPVLTPIANQTMSEDTLKIVIVSASDSDTDPITFSVSGGTSETVSATISNDTLTLVPAHNYFTSDSISFTVTADDGNSGSDEQVFKVVVNGFNDAPVIASVSNKNGTEGAELTFTVTATDVDGDSLSWQSDNLPTGATFIDNNNNSATFTWTPSFTQAGTFNDILLIVNDENGASQSMAIKPEPTPSPIDK
ncbi:MAG: Ig-like domain-containing protein [Candidatus Marinimicrobia bacterium]|nr:Ig-like domain-containing protein [Candidatus Neomarinimicrobiota bacterium]